MAWGAKQVAIQLTNITTQQFFNLKPTLLTGGIAVCQIKAVFPGNNGLRIELFSTLDVSNEEWDTDTFAVFSATPQFPIISFFVRDRYKFRVGVSRDGTTDIITSADFALRQDVVVL